LLDGPDRWRNLVWPWFVARVEVGAEVVGDEVQVEAARERWPRLARLVGPEA